MAKIRSLSSELAENARILAQEFENNGLGDYSFENTAAPIDIPVLSSQASTAKTEILSCALKIVRLVQGLLNHLFRYFLSVC